jgi:RNA polymerase sigma-70 factor (ECF subfamily)
VFSTARRNMMAGRASKRGCSRLLRHLAIDDLRRHQNVSLDAEINEPLDPQSPFLVAARNEEAARLAVALGALEPIYREALLLRFHEDLSLQEISQLVGAPVQTVASRIRRGLERLRVDWERGANDV